MIIILLFFDILRYKVIYFGLEEIHIIINSINIENKIILISYRSIRILLLIVFAGMYFLLEILMDCKSML